MNPPIAVQVRREPAVVTSGHKARARTLSRTRPATGKPLLVSVIIPACNEQGSLSLLVEGIDRALRGEAYGYECIIIDDYSSDGTLSAARALSQSLPVRAYAKEGKKGKAYSLLEGFAKARGSVIAMIDGDLQYPPDAIPDMVAQLDMHDVVVANRAQRETSRIRSLSSAFFHLVFGRWLLGLTVDVQSGMKVFRRKVLEFVDLRGMSPWGFDYNFLFQARRLGCSIGSTDIRFRERRSGKSKVKMFRTSMELALGAIKLRLMYLPRNVFRFLDYPHQSEYRSQGYSNHEDFLFLPEIQSTKRSLTSETVLLVLTVAAGAVAVVLGIAAITGIAPLIVLSGIIALLYVGLIVFKSVVVGMSSRWKSVGFTKAQIAAIDDKELPVYTIIIPLYQEAAVIPQIITAMSAIDYPPEKLDVIITLEEYDQETIQAIESARPPAHFKTLLLPDVHPKTKPKALNVAFLHAKGEFLVIYDAEIIPDADQLKKAFLAFRAREGIACFQTRLDHYNAEQNWLTRLFNAEFCFYYDMFLFGLQRLDFPLPLSGHSTHFRTDALRKIYSWDPYNVAEDCDIGIRLRRAGFSTGMLDSVSQEEATSSVSAWVLQRTRWMKGFLQTSIVHLRHPLRLKRDIGGWKNFIAFLVIVPGSVLINIVNLFYWVLLVTWFVTESPRIQAYFPGPILYLSVTSFVVGNFLFTYLNLLGSYKRLRFSTVKYGLLSPIYWFLLAYATLRAIVQLVVNPHHWEKTRHGQHILSPAYAPTSS